MTENEIRKIVREEISSALWDVSNNLPWQEGEFDTRDKLIIQLKNEIKSSLLTVAAKINNAKPDERWSFSPIKKFSKNS